MKKITLELCNQKLREFRKNCFNLSDEEYKIAWDKVKKYKKHKIRLQNLERGGK